MSSLSTVDGFGAAERSRRRQRILATMRRSDEGVRGASAEEQRIRRWLDLLRDGSDTDKIGARHALARVFEQRDMLEEAIELLETNVQMGASGAETLRRLSRLYQARGDETSSPEAAIHASQSPQLPPASGSPEPVEATISVTRHRATPALRSYALVVVGLGIMVGVVLWMLMPILHR